MSVETGRSSTESSAASGLDFEDTALTLTLRLPGPVSSSSSSSPDPDRKRASSDADHSPLAAADVNASDAPPAPKYVPPLPDEGAFVPGIRGSGATD
jgi:auxin-responsive protein IAA